MQDEGFLASGRRTPFQPKGTSLREQARNARATTGQRVIPQVDREIARNAEGLLASAAFTEVMGDLIDSARKNFENSAFGPDGEKSRAIAHAQIAACNEIVTRLQAMADDAKLYDRAEAELAEHD
jgi:hypothetical protein